MAKLRSVLSVRETTRNGMLVISFGDITGKGMMYHEATRSQLTADEQEFKLLFVQIVP